jgi:uncharacterized protein (DUF58 family)
VVGLVAAQPPLALISALLLLLLGFTRLWAKYALRRVSYTRRLSATRAFAGEDVNFEFSVANRKLLPLPWLEVREEIDEGLVLPPRESFPCGIPGKMAFRDLLSVGWYQRVTRSCRVGCPRRGLYELGPVRLRSGDYFGFWSGEVALGEAGTLLVYPRLAEPEELGLPARALFGNLRCQRHLFEDPTRVMGNRDYLEGDPLRRLNWKATSRHQRLLSKVFEHTYAMSTAVFMDVRTVEPPYWSYFPELLETVVMAAASVTSHAVENRYPVGLYVNQAYKLSRELMKMPPSYHPHQLTAILEALAQVAPLEAVPLEKLLAEETAGLAWPCSILVITAVPLDGLIERLNDLKSRGRAVALVVVGDARPDLEAGQVPVFRIPLYSAAHASHHSPQRAPEETPMAALR